MIVTQVICDRCGFTLTVNDGYPKGWTFTARRKGKSREDMCSECTTQLRTRGRSGRRWYTKNLELKL